MPASATTSTTAAMPNGERASFWSRPSARGGFDVAGDAGSAGTALALALAGSLFATRSSACVPHCRHRHRGHVRFFFRSHHRPRGARRAHAQREPADAPHRARARRHAVPVRTQRPAPVGRQRQQRRAQRRIEVAQHDVGRLVGAHRHAVGHLDVRARMAPAEHAQLQRVEVEVVPRAHRSILASGWMLISCVSSW
jgi:hypothetical protein